jgi:uncharacterized protein HemY
MNEFIQSGIVYLVIVWSVWVTLRRYAPSLIQVPQQHLATWLSHQGFTKAGQYFTPQQIVVAVIVVVARVKQGVLRQSSKRYKWFSGRNNRKFKHSINLRSMLSLT